MNTAILKFQHTDVGYRGQTVVSDVDVAVAPGEIVTLIGPNGAGKSTILKSACAQLKTVAGTIFLDGRKLPEYSRIEAAKHMAVVLTKRPESDLLTCFDIVAAGRYPYTGKMGLLTDKDRARVREAMDMVGLWDIRDRDFSKASDGQKQMLSLARAICQEPEILVLDEPTSFLDISRKVRLLLILRRLACEKKTAVLMSLHELDLAEKISDKVLCVKAGMVDKAGTVQEVFTSEYIGRLYDLQEGWFDPSSGTVQLPDL